MKAFAFIFARSIVNCWPLHALLVSADVYAAEKVRSVMNTFTPKTRDAVAPRIFEIDHAP